MSLFQDSKVVKEWPDGYVMERIRTPVDLEILSKNGGGCAKAHEFWANRAKPLLEYFFVLTKHNKVSCILFCKKRRWFTVTHPQENKNDIIYYGNPLSSTCYDFVAPNDGNRFTNYDNSKRDLKIAMEEYERIKAQALAKGPLGRDNPMKYELDNANRWVSSCREVVESLKRMPYQVCEGTEFQYQNVKLIVLQITGYGGYGPIKEHINEKLVEFTGIGKGAK